MDPIIINVIVPILVLAMPLVLGIAFMTKEQAEKFL